ncbi:alpha-mannosyltransferase [Ascoidea rubescens DSM 1968]|uniref:Glycosyltransferase family 71 protein n=1 Tax=Ascoidea rubescens DSM 1968 TaxID=1344418 RepID=A0A1D2VA71_9ASCO|nr:glycosyltransferase family 71 protein [Ascoidea rubescens DSM 1968]ODV58554.1 glycosyltransferase family 71 protein [Ascoidea rubescens DSM 1968]
MKLFPFLSGKLPTITRYDGEKINFSLTVDKNKKINNNNNNNNNNKDNDRDNDKDILNFGNFNLAKSNSNTCFTKSLRNSFSGKGIAISASDKFYPDLIGLIKVLRALGNTLPIQIVHKNDLSLPFQNKLIKLARSDNLKKYLDLEFPKQELYFVNVEDCISDNYKSYFDGFSNKLLALFFNSFNEIILLDTDTVLFVDPNEFFEFEDYKKNGAFFFKDREYELRFDYKVDLEFFEKLMPNDLDEFFFNINLITNKTKKNRFMSGLKHYMESGVVIINKKTHFKSLINSLTLSTVPQFMGKIWGEKELFWLSSSIMGDESYSFNNIGAVAIGELSLPEQRPNSKSREVCSTHPGHISSEDSKTLLWINSGFKTCKKEGSEVVDMTLDSFKNKYESVEDLKSYYETPLRITGAILPPDASNEFLNNLGEPSRGWRMFESCNGYLWCGFNVAGGNTQNPQAVGKVVEYNEEEQQFFDFLGELWIGKGNDE